MSTNATRDPNDLDPLGFPSVRAYRIASGDARRAREAAGRVRSFHTRDPRLTPEQLARKVGIPVQDVARLLNPPP